MGGCLAPRCTCQARASDRFLFNAAFNSHPCTMLVCRQKFSVQLYFCLTYNLIQSAYGTLSVGTAKPAAVSERQIITHTDIPTPQFCCCHEVVVTK